MRPLLLASVIFALGLSGCTCSKKPGESTPADATSSAADAPAATSAAPPEKPLPAPVRQGSVVARSAKDDLIYIADEDASALHLVALPYQKEKHPLTVTLPGRPAQVLPTGNRVLVTIRDLGLLLVMRADEKAGLVEAGRVPLPADAWGMAITADEKTALVTSAWTHAVSAVDLETQKVRWTVDVAREPRGIAIAADGSRAYVSHLVGAALTRIDAIGSEKPSVRAVDMPAAPLRASYDTKFPASLGYSLTFSPDERRLFVPRHALGAAAAQGWFGAPTVDVMLTKDDAPLAPKRTQPPHFATPPWGNPVEDPVLRTSAPAFAQPRGVIYRKRTDTLLVVSEGNDSLVELDALAIDPSAARRRSVSLSPQDHADGECGAPSGVALSADESAAYIYCRSTGYLALVPLGLRAEWRPLPQPTLVRLAPPPADQVFAEGKRLFYDASDTALSDGLGCAGCHPDGRDDGFVWPQTTDLLNDRPVFNASGGAYPRQTPMLAGRVAAPGPYGWHAENEDLPSRILAGFSLHRWRSWRDQGEDEKKKARAIAEFLRRGLVPPPRRENKELTAEEARGKMVFASAEVGCASCHAGAEYTDRVAVTLRKGTVAAGFEEEEAQNFKTPSLLFVGGSAPYFHDGSAATLEALVEKNDDRMGKTNQLSKEDMAALVAFLKTL